MGKAADVLESLTERAAGREPSSEERTSDLLALPSGELFPLFERPSVTEPQVVAQAPSQIWD